MKHRIVLLAVCAGVFGAAAAAETPAWSVKKLPGCDNLPTRMAGYYQPVELEIDPKAPQYKLPVDLTKLTNAGFVGKLYELRGRGLDKPFKAMLAESGLAAVAAGTQSDVAGFYKSLKQRGLPIFITSDSLLHLYHIQFDETLKDIEEREFFDDAVAISKAIQAEALKLHAGADGEMKDAAKLLVAYASVPVVLLSRTDLRAEAAAARDELRSWPARGGGLWQKQQAFEAKYSELLKVLAEEKHIPAQQFGIKPAVVLAGIEKYLKVHPSGAGQENLIPAVAGRDVRAELDLIGAHRGFSESPLFVYKEDYSQYVPRGHYTRSKKLKQYFKALMWYGRMTFLIRGRSAADTKALIPMPEARKQTLAACMLAGMMETKLADGRTLAGAWDRLYSITAYYVGLADDLTPYEYRGALRDAIGDSFSGATLTDAKNFFKLRKALAKFRKPEIYSGTGDVKGPPAAIADERTLAEALALTQGLRLMGQRYIPDSFMMGKLVYPTVGLFTGEGSPFTLVRSAGGPIRGFPRGLDVMAVLGSKRARYWLKALGDDQYVRYDKTLANVTGKFAVVDRAGWNRNMYWSWLYTLKSLLTEYRSGYPTFMQTERWRDKQLAAALASWSQLRHDTILYAKQSYTMVATGMPAPPKMVEGYVEPVPEFYARLLALTRMTRKGLDDFKVLDAKARNRLASLEKIVQRLLKITEAELANRKLTADDYAFIRSFGDRLKGAVAGVNSDGLETTIVADVHTDATTRTAMEEGTGFLHPMVVVYPMPDGGLVAGVGPVLSHYEFKQPISNRLTDEAWKKMLRSGQAPELPKWARSFTVVPGAEGRPIRPPARRLPRVRRLPPIRRPR